MAEISIEDASKDLDDDVEFIDVMGMYGSLILVTRHLFWCRAG